MRQNSILFIIKWPTTNFKKRFLVQFSYRTRWDLCFIDFQGSDLRRAQCFPWAPSSSAGRGCCLTLALHHTCLPRGPPSCTPPGARWGSRTWCVHVHRCVHCPCVSQTTSGHSLCYVKFWTWNLTSHLPDHIWNQNSFLSFKYNLN